MTSLLYYPGCSMSGSGRAYAASLTAVCAELGLDLEEIDDWNCCGAFEYFALSQARAYALVSRNLALAEKQSNGSRTLVAPCSACYLNLAKTDHDLRENPGLRALVDDALAAGGLQYRPASVEVRHLFEVLVREVGIEEIGRPRHPSAGRPARGAVPRVPGDQAPIYDHRWPTARAPPRVRSPARRALGAEVVDFPLRTACCGGHMTQISPETAFELIRRLLDAADHAEATCIVHGLLPMCQMNVDGYQAELNGHFGPTTACRSCSSPR